MGVDKQKKLCTKVSEVRKKEDGEAIENISLRIVGVDTSAVVSCSRYRVAAVDMDCVEGTLDSEYVSRNGVQIFLHSADKLDKETISLLKKDSFLHIKNATTFTGKGGFRGIGVSCNKNGVGVAIVFSYYTRC